MSDDYKFMDADKPECESCTFSFCLRDGVHHKCFAINRHTDSNLCRFYKTDKQMRIELKRCYLRANNPFYKNFNDYLELLNIRTHTTFYDKYKDGYYGKK